MKSPWSSSEDVRIALAEHGYIAESSLATVLHLALVLERPLFLEGEAGVGKTEVAKVLALALGRPLLRLQCYEGINRESALYEWNYPRQLLHLRVAEAARQGVSHDQVRDEKWRRDMEEELFQPEFLLKRPLLAAIFGDGPAPVLLLDEVDRSDEEFEAFLLEVLSDFQISIPELGTIRAKERPIVLLTSNRTREVHDALKRRCMYHWLNYPDFAKEYAIVRQKVPGLSETLTAKVCLFVQQLREAPLFKLPGLAETIHWAEALHVLATTELSPERVWETMGCLIKYRDDLDYLRSQSDTEGRSVRRLLVDIGVTMG